MADRQGAELFQRLFKEVAKIHGIMDDPHDLRGLVDLLWDEIRRFDFNLWQLEADEALVKLGLAVKCPACSRFVYKGYLHECK
jgi:hypothetical protein